MSSTQNNADYARLFDRLSGRLARRRKNYLNERSAPFGISWPMFNFLLALAREPGSSQDKMAQMLIVDKSAAARTAQELEKLKLIRRETDQQNRRQYRLFLTQNGEQLVPELRAAQHDWGEQLVRGFTPEEMLTASHLLERMLENVTPQD